MSATSEPAFLFTSALMMHLRSVDSLWLLMILNVAPLFTAALLLISVAIAAPEITAVLLKVYVEFSWLSKLLTKSRLVTSALLMMFDEFSWLLMGLSAAPLIMAALLSMSVAAPF